MVSRRTLRQALPGRDVAIAYAVVSALYVGRDGRSSPPADWTVDHAAETHR